MAQLRGGDRFEAALRDLSKRIAKASKVRVGFLEGATYPDGTPVALVAASNEFGTSRIPARPFFRNMIAAKSKDWPEATGDALKTHGFDAKAALDVVGEGIKGQLQQAIVDFDGVPLSPKTIKRKQSAKQLVESGHMLQSVDKEVE